MAAAPQVTEEQRNKFEADLLRAELKGDAALVDKLKAKQAALQAQGMLLLMTSCAYVVLTPSSFSFTAADARGLQLTQGEFQLFGYLQTPVDTVALGAEYEAPDFTGICVEHRCRPVPFINHVLRCIYLLPLGVRHQPLLLQGLVMPQVFF